MDESDMKLAEQLREQLEANGAKTAFGAPAATPEAAPSKATPQGEQDDAGSLVEGPFAQAMAAYRKAKRSATPRQQRQPSATSRTWCAPSLPAAPSPARETSDERGGDRRHRQRVQPHSR